jgi:Domain of unknown function (DUF4262)
MSTLDQSAARNLIQSNINRFGHHIYLVRPSGAVPRFAYTIGLTNSVRFELVLAGATVYSAEEVKYIINEVAFRLIDAGNWSVLEPPVGTLGTFSLRKVEFSWIDSLLLGAMDFYGRKEINALQIVPDEEHWTIDTPDLSKVWNAASEPVWQWLRVQWPFPFAAGATATTNLAALKGQCITEAARWEEDHWELFVGAGPDIPKEDLRVVPLGTLLAIDPTLIPATKLDIGCAIWRDQRGSQWNQWS